MISQLKPKQWSKERSFEAYNCVVSICLKYVSLPLQMVTSQRRNASDEGNSICTLVWNLAALKKNKANRHIRVLCEQRETDGLSDRPTNKAAYRVACTRLKNHYGYSTWSIFSIGHLLTDLQRFYELIICITFSFSVTAPLFLSRVAEHKINLHFSFQNSTSWSKNMNKRKKSVIGYW